jgi:hypothetical protein
MLAPRTRSLRPLPLPAQSWAVAVPVDPCGSSSPSCTRSRVLWPDYRPFAPARAVVRWSEPSGGLVGRLGAACPQLLCLRWHGRPPLPWNPHSYRRDSSFPCLPTEDACVLDQVDSDGLWRQSSLTRSRCSSSSPHSSGSTHASQLITSAFPPAGYTDPLAHDGIVHRHQTMVGCRANSRSQRRLLITLRIIR